jgi:hypothetical protein
VVVVAVVEVGFQIFFQVEMVVVLAVSLVVHQVLVMPDEDNHHQQVFEMIILILELMEQVSKIVEIIFYLFDC